MFPSTWLRCCIHCVAPAEVVSDVEGKTRNNKSTSAGGPGRVSREDGTGPQGKLKLKIPGHLQPRERHLQHVTPTWSCSFALLFSSSSHRCTFFIPHLTFSSHHTSHLTPHGTSHTIIPSTYTPRSFLYSRLPVAISRDPTPHQARQHMRYNASKTVGAA